ncbi:CPK2, partial [Symbiodinium pilosum]
ATFDRKQSLTKAVCKTAFAAFDRNGDGTISMAELSSGRLLGQLSLDELSVTLKQLD